MMKRYLIAGLTVDMDAIGRTYDQAAPYEIPMDDHPADIILEYDAKDLVERHPDKFPTESDAQYFAFSFLFAREVLAFDGYYLHSSSVILDGKAYLFTATSGTGKSTHTEKWCRLSAHVTSMTISPFSASGMESGWPMVHPGRGKIIYPPMKVYPSAASLVCIVVRKIPFPSCPKQKRFPI